MLEQLSEQVRECLAFAAEAKERADATTDPAQKSAFLEVERRWLLLARSHAFTEGLGDFTAANDERLRHLDEVIRDKAKTQGARRDEQRWLRSIVESSDDAIVSKGLDGVIMSWNRGAEQVFGYKAEEVIGKPVTILMPPDRQREEPVILARIRAGEKIDHYETVT